MSFYIENLNINKLFINDANSFNRQAEERSTPIFQSPSFLPTHALHLNSQQNIPMPPMQVSPPKEVTPLAKKITKIALVLLAMSIFIFCRTQGIMVSELITSTAMIYYFMAENSVFERRMESAVSGIFPRM